MSKKNGAFFWVVIIFLMLALISCQEKNQLGVFEHATDIGNPKLNGTVNFDRQTNTYTISGGGYNIWFHRDEFHYLSTVINGDFSLEAQITFTGQGTEPHRKIGIMLRDSLKASSAHVCAAVHANGLSALQFRRSSGNGTEEILNPVLSPSIIKLERIGTRILFSAAANADSAFQTVELPVLPLQHELHLGLFVCSHHPDELEEATFENVILTIPTNHNHIDSIQQAQ